jgi:hypothetical protein
VLAAIRSTPDRGQLDAIVKVNQAWSQESECRKPRKRADPPPAIGNDPPATMVD